MVYRQLVFPLIIYFAVPASQNQSFQCKVITLFSKTFTTAIFISLVAIAVDRYQNIARPLKTKACFTCFCGLVVCCHCVGAFCFQRGQHFSFGNSRRSRLGGLRGLRRQETLRHSAKFVWSELYHSLFSLCVRNSTGHYICAVHQSGPPLTSQRQQGNDAQNGGKIKVQSGAHARYHCIWICP